MRRTSQATLLLAFATVPCAAAPETTLIGGHSYAFPPALFMGGKESGPVGDMLIEFAWPEMRPLTPAEKAAWPPRTIVRVLANSAAPVNGQAVPEAKLLADMPSAVSAAAFLSSGIKERSSGHLRPLTAASGAGGPAQAQPGEGMQKVETDPQISDALHHEIFVREPIDQPQEFIDCIMKDGPVVDPACAQTFVAANLIIKASYPQALAPQWRDIHARIAAYLAQHEVRK